MAGGIVDVLRRQVASELRRGRLGEADSALARLEEREPLAVETRGLRLEWLLRSERLEEAERLAEQLVALFPASPRVQLLAGRASYRRRDYPRAAERFRESDALHPSPFARMLFGRALTQLGRFDEAEAVLTALAAELPRARLDLAWLHERCGAHARALSEVERFLEQHPDDAQAASQRRRLLASLAAPDELRAEVEELAELGEAPAPELVPEYVRALLVSGEVDRARAFLAERADELPSRTVTKCAWEIYRLQAHDLALELFLRVLAENARNAKFLAALEAAARRSGRLADLAAAYRERAALHPPLHGRALRIEKALESR